MYSETSLIKQLPCGTVSLSKGLDNALPTGAPRRPGHAPSGNPVQPSGTSSRTLAGSNPVCNLISVGLRVAVRSGHRGGLGQHWLHRVSLGRRLAQNASRQHHQRPLKHSVTHHACLHCHCSGCPPQRGSIQCSVAVRQPRRVIILVNNIDLTSKYNPLHGERSPVAAPQRPDLPCIRHGIG